MLRATAFRINSYEFAYLITFLRTNLCNNVWTPRGVSAMSARENYIKSRRNPQTVNWQEIVGKIREIFSNDLVLAPSVLTREVVLF